MKKAPRQIITILISIIASGILLSCGDPLAPEEETAITNFQPGFEADISRFNSSNIYSLVSYLPYDHAEGEDAYYMATRTYTLDTNASADGSPVPVSGRTPGSLDSGQQASDLKLRSLENKLLASGLTQGKKSLAGVDAAIASPEIGTEREIYIYATDHTITAECCYISDEAYFMVDSRDVSSIDTGTRLADYAAAFTDITTTNRAMFGTENDVDSNGKVFIVITRELSGGLLGYFFAVDKYDDPYRIDLGYYYEEYTSNEADIFYITADLEYQGDIATATLAHEYQHMIYFDEHYNRGVEESYSWLNEALSQAAEYHNGYLDNHLAWIGDFLAGGYSGLSLTYWTSGNYGYGAVFIRYLIDRFGADVTFDLCSTSRIGTDAVEHATGMNFNDLFRDFMKALAVSGTGDVSESAYNFISLDLRSVQATDRGGLLPLYTFNAGQVITHELAPYELSFVNWSGSFGTMNLYGLLHFSDFQGAAYGLSY